MGNSDDFQDELQSFVLFTGIEPTQAPPFIPHLRGGSLLAGKDKTSLFNVFDKVSRYAADDSIRWDVPVHDGTGCDDGITADSDPGCYGRISPNPGAFMQDDPARHELTPFIRGWMMIERS